MSTRRPIALFPVPPDSDSSRRLRAATASSDFPPARIAPSPPHPAPIHPPRPRPRPLGQKLPQPRHGGTPNKGLGQKNCANTIHAKDSAKLPKLSLKRGLEADGPDERALKKNRLLCVEEDDIDSVMDEIKNIREMMEQFSRDVDHRLGKLFYKVQQLS